jgi:hypothetical protein
MRTLDERPSILIRDKAIFSPVKMLHKDYGHKCSVGGYETLVVVLKGLDDKAN